MILIHPEAPETEALEFLKEHLSGVRKAAILCVSMTMQGSHCTFQTSRKDEVEAISREIAFSKILNPASSQIVVIEEFHGLFY